MITSDNLNLKTLNPDVDWVMTEQKLQNQLQAARYSMHKVRLMHYQTMMKNGVMQPDIAKQFYLAAMQNYDDVLKGNISGAFNEAIEREMADFNVNEAFA